jgi:hypothetical protein
LAVFKHLSGIGSLLSIEEPPIQEVTAVRSPIEQLEGAPVDGAAVIEFPSFDAAKSWYNSPAYHAIGQHRLNGAR